jgi:hypothetical protein
MSLDELAVDVAKRLGDGLQQDTYALLLGSPLRKPEGMLQSLSWQQSRNDLSGPVLCPFNYHSWGWLCEIVGLEVADGVALRDFY